MKRIINSYCLIVLLICSSFLLFSCGHTHNYTEEIVKPTCTEKGYTIYKCECGDTYNDNYVNPSHTFTDYVYNDDATCDSDGTKTAKCDLCDAVDTITASGTAGAHKIGDDGYCELCMHHPEETTDLEFLLNDQSYSVRWSSNCRVTDIIIPKIHDGKPVTKIEYGGFENRSTITSVVIPDSVTEIEFEAFKNCTSLKSIVIPDSVTIIGDEAFAGCSSLTSIELPNNISSIKSLFKDCTSLVSVSIPDKVASLYGSFQNCTSLESIVLPDNLIHISGNTFKNCTSLKSLIIPDGVWEIGSEAFAGCTSLESIKLPNSLIKIDWKLFDGCTSLTEIEIPSKVKLIVASAFKNCSSLKSIVIPENVEEIGKGILEGCTSLESLTAYFVGEKYDQNTYLGYFFSYEENVNPIPASLKQIKFTGEYIYNNTFANINSIETLIISNDITYIAENSFSNTLIKKMYFQGTYEEWNQVNNKSFDITATLKYYYSETKPNENADRFWHYDTDGVTPIIWIEE